MSHILEEDWKKALCSILEELSDDQYEKLLELELTEMPKSQREARVKMSQMIIEHYGLEKSISVISDAMEQIPRRDARVRSLLRPFVEKLENDYKKNKGKKRKHDLVEKEKSLAAEGDKKKKCDPVDERKSQIADQQMSCTPDGETKPQTSACSLKISIHDLKNIKLLDNNYTIGRVIRKSGLRMYRTKDNVKKPFFHIAVADEEDSVRMMVYGKKRYREIKENGLYSFRGLIKDECSVKVIQRSVVANRPPKSVQIPESVETEAHKLIYSDSPFYSTADAKTADRTVSVEGTVSEINPVRDKRQDFELTDQTGPIRIVMWDDQTKACKQLTVGDVVQVTNLKPKTYFRNVSLNSTGFTKIIKIQSVGVQKRKIEIEGIIKANKKTTQLEVLFDGQMHIFVIGSPLLAKEFGLKLEGDWSENLLDKMPLVAEAEIHGNRIKKITAVQ